MIAQMAKANTTLQHLVHSELRGRLMAENSFLVVGLSQVVGSLLAGSIAHAIGTSWAIGSGAVVMLGFAYYALELRPELRGVT